MKPPSRDLRPAPDSLAGAWRISSRRSVRSRGRSADAGSGRRGGAVRPTTSRFESRTPKAARPRLARKLSPRRSGARGRSSARSTRCGRRRGCACFAVRLHGRASRAGSLVLCWRPLEPIRSLSRSGRCSAYRRARRKRSSRPRTVRRRWRRIPIRGVTPMRSVALSRPTPRRASGSRSRSASRRESGERRARELALFRLAIRTVRAGPDVVGRLERLLADGDRVACRLDGDR